MAEYTLLCFAQSGNAYKPALASARAGCLFRPDEIGVDWAAYPAIASWLARIEGRPGWVHPYRLMPGHPLPATA